MSSYSKGKVWWHEFKLWGKCIRFYFFVFETGSCYAAQAGPELTILLSQTPDVREHAWPHFTNFLKVGSKKLFQRKADNLPVQQTFQSLLFHDSIFFLSLKKTLYVIITKVIWNLQQQQSLESLIEFVMSPVILVIQPFLGAQWCLKKQNRISWNV